MRYQVTKSRKQAKEKTLIQTEYPLITKARAWFYKSTLLKEATNNKKGESLLLNNATRAQPWQQKP